MSALCVACSIVELPEGKTEADRIEMIKELIAHGADVNWVGFKLGEEVRREYQCLECFSSSVLTSIFQPVSVMISACLNGTVDAVKCLLDAGALVKGDVRNPLPHLLYRLCRIYNMFFCANVGFSFAFGDF